MKWATRSVIHLDRVVSAWLILRFVDREAEFIFLQEGETHNDAVLFGIPGAPLSPHDNSGTTFQRILNAYSVNDPALTLLGEIVAEVVAHVMRDRERSGTTEREQHVGGILAIAEGIMLLSSTDAECLNLSLPLYDALYTRLHAQIVLDALLPSPPATVLEQTMLFAKGTRVLRQSNCVFSSDTFTKAVCS